MFLDTRCVWWLTSHLRRVPGASAPQKAGRHGRGHLCKGRRNSRMTGSGPEPIKQGLFQVCRDVTGVVDCPWIVCGSLMVLKAQVAVQSWTDRELVLNARRRP